MGDIHCQGKQVVALTIFLGLLGPLSVVFFWRWCRARLYATTQTVTPDNTIAISEDSKAQTEKLAQLAIKLGIQHRDAKAAQGQFQDIVSLAIGCVLFAFVIFSIEISFDFGDKSLSKTVYLLELILLLSGLALFYVAKRKLSHWMKERMKAELLRQRYFCCWINVDADVKYYDTDALEDWTDELDVASQIEDTKISDVAKKASRQNISILEGLDQEKTQKLLPQYLARRVLRQKVWFRDSSERIEKFIVFREWSLIVVFGLAIFAALLKSMHYWFDLIPYYPVLSSYLTLVSLLALAITAGLAALLLSQNSSNLMATYARQEDAIERIAASIKDLKTIRDGLIEFENLMSNELLFFLDMFEANAPEISL